MAWEQVTLFIVLVGACSDKIATSHNLHYIFLSLWNFEKMNKGRSKNEGASKFPELICVFGLTRRVAQKKMCARKIMHALIQLKSRLPLRMA